jgi:primase-polymerase (primpol)-like protein
MTEHNTGNINDGEYAIVGSNGESFPITGELADNLRNWYDEQKGQMTGDSLAQGEKVFNQS